MLWRKEAKRESLWVTDHPPYYSPVYAGREHGGKGIWQNGQLSPSPFFLFFFSPLLSFPVYDGGGLRGERGGGGGEKRKPRTLFMVIFWRLLLPGVPFPFLSLHSPYFFFCWMCRES